MRKHLFFTITVASLFIITSCKKESNKSGSVLQGYRDSMYHYNTTYASGEINSLSYVNGGLAWNFEHKENYVKASTSDFYVEYFLNESKLPKRIFKNYQASTNEIFFHYKMGTNLLDSAVSVNSFAWAQKEKYTFTYNGGNITQVAIQFFYKDGTSGIISISYTYYSAPNIFRNTDSLLYIYINPAADLSYNNILFYFPKVFSEATFHTYSIQHAVRPRQGKLNYTLNNKGKIAKEWYEDYGYSYEYFY
jgi:hypothetical protein